MGRGISIATEQTNYFQLILTIKLPTQKKKKKKKKLYMHMCVWRFRSK